MTPKSSSSLPMPNHNSNSNDRSWLKRAWTNLRFRRRCKRVSDCSNGSSSTNSTNSTNNNVNNNNRFGFKKKKESAGLNSKWDSELSHAEGQNSVPVFDLFRYANRNERIAALAGALLMLYAASWQPISVFILAIMASLMGQYSKRVLWLRSINETTTNITQSDDTQLPITPMMLRSLLIGDDEGSLASMGDDFFVKNPQLNYERHTNPYLNKSVGSYDDFSLLGGALQTLVDKLFDRFCAGTWLSLSSSSNDIISLNGNQTLVSDLININSGGSGTTTSDAEIQNLQAIIENLIANESGRFLRKSFEINATAFLLALTQLAAFFFGMSLIIWMARKQASRIKLLYFDSCLHQEVTWFESIDSAGGSGSSLNSLMEKYEDGIGVKLALLCYFLGHVTLFATTAFYQMIRLAAFCMPFVALVGICIALLSERQAIAIGQQALFSKRSLQLAEEILAAIRTVFAFNGQQKELTRYSLCLRPVYRKSLVKHLYTALNTSLSKFSIFACFAIYCFYAKYLFPPHTSDTNLQKSTILAVLRGAEVSIVNILISIPFLEALQQSRGSIARIYAAIERRSKIDARSQRGAKPIVSSSSSSSGNATANNDNDGHGKWSPTISFRMVQFSYADRCGPTRRRSTLPSLGGLTSATGGGNLLQHMAANANKHNNNNTVVVSTSDQSVPMVAERLPPLAPPKRTSIVDEILVDDCDGARSVASALSDHRRVSIVSPVMSRHCSMRGVARMNAKAAAEAARETSIQLNDLLILRRFNLEIKAGQSVALVGPSGSGKSTVLALVQRLYDITSGQLLIGSHNIKDLNVGWLRNQISVVPQEPRLFDLSIADNIKLGLPSDCCVAGNGPIDEARIMQQVVEAAREANAHDFIARLPDGYSTRVGSSAGVQLSGGQKQRIAIARALIRKPKILLLDECTSALDSDSENQVQIALQRASANRTTLIVAHRLDTIKHVDLIVVMNNGQVIGCGTHDELMSAAARSAPNVAGAVLYKQLYEEQMRSLAASRRKSLSGHQINHRRLNESGANIKVKIDEDDDGSRSNADDDDDDDYEEGKYDDEVYDDDVGSDIVDINCEMKPSARELWSFMEMPKWSALASCFVCLLGGLILPMNLIAHSYLFSSFAYNEPEQIGLYLNAFGMLMLSFSAFVFIVSFLQVILPGYVGEKLSVRLRVKIMDSLLSKPMFYFDMPSNSAGAICDKFNGHISSLQSIAGTRSATMIEACSTLLAGAFFGFGKNLQLSMFCLSFALLVLVTTIIESNLVERETQMQQKFDTQLAHLMADALSNIKTIASLNKEKFFTQTFKRIVEQREFGIGLGATLLRTFLTSFKFIMPAMSWSASMYYASRLLAGDQIDLQTIFIVCPVVLFAVNDTFRALVFLPELLRARKSIEHLYKLEQEFSPQTLQTLTLAQQLEQQYQLYQKLQQQQQSGAAPSGTGSGRGNGTGGDSAAAPVLTVTPTLQLTEVESSDRQTEAETAPQPPLGAAKNHRLSVSSMAPQPPSQQRQDPRRLSTASAITLSAPLPTYMSIDPSGGDSADGLGPSSLGGSSQAFDNDPSNPNGRGRRRSSRLNSLVPEAQSRGRIEFRDVHFAYPSRPSAPVLSDFSLTIAPGESVAIVGSSGSGKSTAVAILEKFYDFHAGQVFVDGRDLRLLEPSWIRQQIGLVSQEPCLLSYTIGDNIRYGDNSRFVGMAEVVEAARAANIHDFIMSLPDQYDTELASSAHSSSCQLSGGQRQRIAIARALVRRAPILIFDEATSALDNRSEALVQDALARARKNRTSLTIAHRLKTVQDADKIVVLMDGKVVECGKHDELIRKPDGHYRALWSKQEPETEVPAIASST